MTLELLITLGLCFIVGYLCHAVNQQHKRINKVVGGVSAELELIKKAHDANFLNFKDELERQLNGHNNLVESTRDIANRHSKLAESTRELGEHMLKINTNVNLIAKEVGIDG